MPNHDDPRHIRTGREIPSEFYADQPYLVKAADGAWVCAHYRHQSSANPRRV
jgi:hypothetical protein